MTAPITVLVIDDDPSLRLLCRINLEVEGYAVLEAATAAEAKASLGPHVDVVLLDLHLGTQDSRALLEEIRSARPGLPVALFTGSATLDELSNGIYDAVIRKPFTIEELTGTVRRLATR
jgi:DNA-binding NtrC family response regulator